MERNPRIEEELFPFYALDALTEEERAEVEKYVAGNPEARLRLDELTAAAFDLGATVDPIAPDPSVKAGLMARIEAEQRAAPAAVRSQTPATPKPQPQPKPAPSRNRWRTWAPALGFAAAVLVLLAAGAYILNLNGQISGLEATVQSLRETVAELESNVGALQVQNDELQSQLQAREDQLASYTSPGAITLALGDITGENPEAVGTLTITPDSDTGTLSVANLPSLEGTQTYQAWLIVDGAPVSAGTFDVDEAGAASHAIPDAQPGAFDAVGVSIEPAGGSNTPTPGNIMLLGEAY